jgi:lysozyme family protein
VIRAWLARLRAAGPAPIPRGPADGLGALTLPAGPAGPPPNTGSGVQPAPPIRVHVIGDPAPMLTPDQRFARCLPIILKHEGGFVDHPRDPGGATNHGISLRYMRSQGRIWDLDGDGDVDRDDVLRVTVEKAGIAYRSWFWADVRADDLPAGLDLVLFDYAVNSGPARPIRALQRRLGVQADGVFGPATLAAVRGINDHTGAVLGICAERLAFMKGLSTWDTFGRGWQRRVEDIQRQALQWV